MALREDQAVYPTLIRLSACLCAELEKAEGPALCYCGPIAGPLVLDFCGGDCGGDGCGGQAWVRVTEIFPSSSFPSPEQLPRNCGSPLAYNLEIGVARCAPTGEGNGIDGYSPPTLEQNVEALRLQMTDMAAVRRAVQCCFGVGEADYILGQYSQIDVSQGGCLGGSFIVTVWEEF